MTTARQLMLPTPMKQRGVAIGEAEQVVVPRKSVAQQPNTEAAMWRWNARKCAHCKVLRCMLPWLHSVGVDRVLHWWCCSQRKGW